MMDEVTIQVRAAQLCVRCFSVAGVLVPFSRCLQTCMMMTAQRCNGTDGLLKDRFVVQARCGADWDSPARGCDESCGASRRDEISVHARCIHGDRITLVWLRVGPVMIVLLGQRAAFRWRFVAPTTVT